MSGTISLSSIKFDYLDKIQNLNTRIEKYVGIINDYDKIIERAEKQEEQNISAVLTSKEKYQKRIKNMECVKGYYQEFVDTSDYLMQNLNKEEQFQLIAKYNALKNDYETLLNINKHLEEKIEEDEEVIKNKNLLLDLEKIKVRDLRKKYKAKIDDLKEIHNTKLQGLKEKYNAELDDLKINQNLNSNKRIDKLNSKNVKKQSVINDKNHELKEYRTKIKKISAEINCLEDRNKFLENRNDYLEKRCKWLEDYCNELLNRKEAIQ